MSCSAAFAFVLERLQIPNVVIIAAFHHHIVTPSHIGCRNLSVSLKQSMLNDTGISIYFRFCSPRVKVTDCLSPKFARNRQRTSFRQTRVKMHRTASREYRVMRFTRSFPEARTLRLMTSPEITGRFHFTRARLHLLSSGWFTTGR